MAVVVNDPTNGSYYGGLVAGPVFHNVMEGALRLMDVAPDDIETWIAAQEKADGKHTPAILPVAAIPADVHAALPVSLPGDVQ